MNPIAVAQLGIAQAVVASLGTVLIIGLGFLQRPSRSSLLWSLAFVLAMVSTWLTLAGEAVSSEAFRRAGLGLMLGAPTLIWSGFRARRGVRALPWVAVLQAAGSAVVLVLLNDPQTYALGFRTAFFLASVFAGFTLWEMYGFPDRQGRLAIPLGLVSAAFVLLGHITLVAGLISPPRADDDLALTRVLSSIGMLVYLVCATVSLLFLTSTPSVGAQTARSWAQFSVVAQDRLVRAREAGESGWVVLSVRIDDPDDIRAAVGDASFAHIVDRFERLVVAAFPAEADIGREGRGRLVVLLSRPGLVIREQVRVLLRRVTEMDAAQQISVQLSASVGWAPADVVGYDLDALLTASRRAASEAWEGGGDRWRRIGA